MHLYTSIYSSIFIHIFSYFVCVYAHIYVYMLTFLSHTTSLPPLAKGVALNSKEAMPSNQM